MINTAIPEHWRWATLEEIQASGPRAIVSGPFGSNIGSKFFVDSGVPVIRGNNLTTDLTRFIDDGFVFVTEEKATELSGCIALPGDLVFTAAGSLGQVGLIPRNARYPKYVISNKQLRARLNNELVDEVFAFYWFSSPAMVDYIQQRNTGSSVPLINLSILRSLPFPLGPLAEQRAIAHILGTLDDKIELNRRMNATLEGIARAIFKSWFVDFDPVHAKARGEQPYGMAAETAALFPDSFEDSELGPIPAGWGVKPIGDTVTVVGGSTPRTKVAEYWEGGTISWATPKDLASLSSPVLLETSRQITEKGLAKISSGLLPKGTVLLSSRAPVGYLAIAEIPVAVNQGFIAMVCDQEMPSQYVYNWAKANMDLIESQANGTTFLEISKRNFRPIQLLIPPKDILCKFSRLTEPIYRRIVCNEKEIRTLAALRDALLPKLISGEICVNALEEISGG